MLKSNIGLNNFLSNFENVTHSGSGYLVRCPNHDDQHNSLSISEESGKILLKCFAGCVSEEILQKVGCEWPDLMPEKIADYRSEIVAIYCYRDELSQPLYEVVRFSPKKFIQRHRDSTGKFISNIKGIRRVPYRLPEILKAVSLGEPIFVVEGEKDCENLAAIGLQATTNAGGAEKWRAEFSKFLKNASVILLPDNDDPGRKHSLSVAKSLLGLAKSIKIIELQGLPPKGDVSDWLDKGGTKEGLLALAESANEFNPNDFRTTPTTSVDDEGGISTVGGSEEIQAVARVLRKLSKSLSGLPGGAPVSKKIKTVSQILLELVDVAGCEFWHTAERKEFVSVPYNNHIENYPIHSSDFRNWLRRRFYLETGKTPSSQGLQDTLDHLAAIALFEGNEYKNFLRCGEFDGKIFIDLCNADWQTVEISTEGWKIINDPPIKFIRKPGMLPLPLPERGGNLDDLKNLLNIQDKGSWILILAWLVAALRPLGAYPVLNLIGEQGSGKTTLARILRKLIDPHKVPLRAEPKDEHNLMVAANNSRVLAYDNFSRISDSLSDALCRVATGGGGSARTLYSDDAETFFDFTLPQILTGINDLATRSDLLDRSIIVTPVSISEESRLPETELWYRFDQMYSKLLGCLLDAISTGLKNQNSTRLPKLPRMADFAIWVSACGPSLSFSTEEFLIAYTGNISEAHHLALDHSPVAGALACLLDEINPYIGPVSSLLAALESRATEIEKRSQAWPRDPIRLSKLLRRLTPNFKIKGIQIEFFRQRGGNRFIKVDRVEKITSPLSPLSPTGETTNRINNLQGDVTSDVRVTLREKSSLLSPVTSPPKSFKINAGDSGDNGDSKKPTLSTEGWEDEDDDVITI